jgi:hypothetical protein
MLVIHRLAVLSLLSLHQLSSTSFAFVVPLLAHHHHSKNANAMTDIPGVSVVSMAEDSEDTMEQDIPDETNAVRVETGSHDELMYALGVNLARQLGDIRPLVETGEELAQVAKGLLDTVVGRLNEDGQRLLLAQRGKELDGLIAKRA